LLKSYARKFVSWSRFRSGSVPSDAPTPIMMSTISHPTANNLLVNKGQSDDHAQSAASMRFRRAGQW
jgi:hypothetical protein